MPEETPEYHAGEIRKFARIFALIVAILAALPVLMGFAIGQTGYLPFHLSLDDHMVYAAWMRQAMEGQVLFDNRFTTDPQPGLTFHLYFLLLGWIAKGIGIPLALTLARIVLAFFSVKLLGELLVRLNLQSFTGKFALVMAVFGGGIAFVNWHTFGDAVTRGPQFLSKLSYGLQPIDNWQPEAFVFPSMLTNGLFLAALCLILVTVNSILDAKTSWKPVITGAIAFALLANIHTYDIVLIALVFLVFLATLFASKTHEKTWTLRALVISLGAIPPGVWLIYVLSQDPVFQARAATLTYTGPFVQILLGILPLVLLAVLAILRSDLDQRRKAIGASLLCITLVWLLIDATPSEGYLVSQIGWIVALILAAATAVSLAKKDTAWNLLWSWAMVALVAPYFPALFQRKLSMMLVVPWAILAAIALAGELKKTERQQRNLVAALALAIICLSSVFWLRRDFELLRLGVSKTAVHNLFLTSDEQKVVQKLNEDAYGKVVLAIPGIAAPTFDQQAFVTDLSPIVSGLTGAYTYAGHWSETPNYTERRNQATAFFTQRLTREQRFIMLRDWKIDYIVAPMPTAYEGLPDLRYAGQVVYQGEQLALIKVSLPEYLESASAEAAPSQ